VTESKTWARVTEMPADSAVLAEPEPARALDSSAVFRAEFSYVWNTLRRLGVYDSDLEDVTHEVFLRVHAQLPLFDTTRPLRAWLFGIALGVAANYRRLARHRKLDFVAVLPECANTGDSPAQDLERREQAGLVHAALQKVPLDQRAVLVLHELDGYPIPEVAISLGLALNTAYSRLRLGREAFRAAYRRLLARKGKS
jgi:RNA polymerase sigma-70 factor (ECF subfamily)